MNTPDTALLWVEAHYDHFLLQTIRSYGLGGPMAAMLSPDEPALIVFGSILDDRVLTLAQNLCEVSHFKVLIRPLDDDPVKGWNDVTEEPNPTVETESHDPQDNEEDGSNQDMEETQSMVDSDDSMDNVSTANLDIGTTGVFRLRGGAHKHVKFDSWKSPEHEFNVHLGVKSNVEYRVPIICRTQFTVQSKYTDEVTKASRPQAICKVYFSVNPSSQNYRDVWPDRSYSRAVFLSSEQISQCVGLPCEGYTRPGQTVKTVETKTRGTTATATLTGSMLNPVMGAVSVAGNSVKTQTTENQNDQVTPKWIVDCKSDGWENFQLGTENRYCWQQSFAYAASPATDKTRDAMQVEFSIELRVREPENADFPETSFVIQNQTMLWMRDKALRSHGYGMAVLSFAYIPDITTQTEIFITETPPTVEIGSLSKTNTDQLSLLVRVATPKFSVLSRRPKTAVDQASGYLIVDSDIPLDDINARGYNCTREQWMSPDFPQWRDLLKKFIPAPGDAPALEMDLITAKSKGKQRDPGLPTSEQVEDEGARVDRATDK
ncbi:hypothetical protein C8F04DRAFT_1119059 [Mycena alexandri]|uniref:Uncharacterized protein n=1 Tax=Mycena alexandri TaxID=1745969 RepID=A0AAD6SKS2_9AGAR|nr:hypothetical protein C8F04DRAFT_1119059 [Mycena alexandri]